ncbi:hypothetical protein TNCV_1167021 [Trichonephila clavipes]|uniref:Uncharacterized protein n=1 Tax=Trichonephila clavipes TaxID=2585209 RepID=A0A8X6SWR4_TRICX|nr:hypothetical protein TNCV_1167021 [Trichonephila clavipes]
MTRRKSLSQGRSYCLISRINDMGPRTTGAPTCFPLRTSYASGLSPDEKANLLQELSENEAVSCLALI